MVARRKKFFTTEQVTELLGLGPEEKWRVTKFVKSREYGIEPSVSVGSGHGSRRLYDIENVCEVGLALRLLETGLRPRVIGHVLREVRREGKLSGRLKIDKETARVLYLGILVVPQTGKPLDASRIRRVGFFEGFQEVERFIDSVADLPFVKDLPDVDARLNFDVLMVAVGLMFFGINERLESERPGGES